jgi:mannosyltransferase
MTEVRSALALDGRRLAADDGGAKQVSPSARRRWLGEGVLAAAIGLTALGLALFRLPGTSLWGDEAFSVGLVKTSWHEFVHYLWGPEENMALYYLLLRGWVGLAYAIGHPANELWLRAPSVVAGVLGVLVLYALGFRYFGKAGGVTAAALCASNYLIMDASAEARSYSLQVLLVTASWYALFAALLPTGSARRWWIAYTGLMVLAIYTHLFSALVLAAQITCMGVFAYYGDPNRASRVRRLLPMMASVAGICVLLLPIGVDALVHGESNVWLPPATPTDLARAAWNMANHNVALALLMAGLAAVAARAAIARPGGRAWPAATPESGQQLVLVGLVCWFVVPVAVSYLVTQPYLNTHLFGWRYLIVVIPPMCLLAGAGMAALNSARLRVAVGVALAVLVASSLPWYYSNVQKQDFRTPSLWIEAMYQGGDGVVCSTWSCSIGIQYYLSLDQAPPSLDNSPGTWSWPAGKIDPPLDANSLAIYTARHHRVFFVDSMLGGDPPDVKARAEAAREWLDNHGTLVATATTSASYFGPVTVRVYQF